MGSLYNKSILIDLRTYEASVALISYCTLRFFQFTRIYVVIKHLPRSSLFYLKQSESFYEVNRKS